MDREILEHYASFYSKQEGQRYPCSNQVVICGIITNNIGKALYVMDKKGATLRWKSNGMIEWELGNERWLFRNWNESCRGYRFYKIIVDENVDEETFKYLIKPCCDSYCCSFEII